MFNKILPALICFSVTTISSAESSSGLSMNVNGFVYAQPVWSVAGVQGGASVTFEFSHSSNPSDGHYDLDSSINSTQLKIPPGAPITSTITLTNPTGCTIGGLKGTEIPNNNVKLVTADGAERESGNLTTDLFTQTNQTTKLRFKSVPSTATGNVACNSAGSLTYSF